MWKSEGDEILLMGDFNKNVYTGALTTSLAHDDLCMHDVFYQTTGTSLPAMTIHGSTAIDAVYSTAGLAVSAIAIHPFRTGVGDHQIFMVDIESATVMGNSFPQVIKATTRLLNCSSNKIKLNYVLVLNQLANRHLIFIKLLRIDKESDYISQTQVQLQLSKIDLELEQFMKSSERASHKIKRDCIEWSPIAGIWVHRRWLLTRVKDFLVRNTTDSCNLIRECKKRGVKDPRQMTEDELKTEFLVCKLNLDTVAKNSPQLRKKFLKNLVTEAKRCGDANRASKLLGIIQKELTKKQWRCINKSTCKRMGNLTMSVKVPTADGGFGEFKTEEGVYQAVSTTSVKRFQTALGAQCHQGTFFEDVGHLADGPLAQQILEGS